MRVLLGPINTAGSAYRLAQALRAAGIDAESAAVARNARSAGILTWPADRLLPDRWASRDWDRHLAGFTHVLMWTGLSPRGPGRWFDQDRYPHAAIVATGSEIRRPLVHRELEPWSPFGDDPLTKRLVAYTNEFHKRLRRQPLPVFVHTTGMLDYVTGTWLPIIADEMPDGPTLKRKRPVAFYGPTNPQLKGAQYVEALERDGFDLVHPPEMLAPADTLRAIARADILIGGMVLGDFGLTEIDGMAAGRVVIANVGERVRKRLPEDPPIVHATPDTLQSVIADVLANRDKYRELAARGPGYVERWHDGRASVEALSSFLR